MFNSIAGSAGYSLSLLSARFQKSFHAQAETSIGSKKYFRKDI